MGKNEIILEKESRETELIQQSVNIPCKASIFNMVPTAARNDKPMGSSEMAECTYK